MITINKSSYGYNVRSIRTSHAADSSQFNKHRKTVGRKTRHCNICKQLFNPEYKYQLFCGKCRVEDDSFIFSEWLPHVPEQYSTAVGS